MSNPKVAAAVAEICMMGLAATVQATKGPPKPDKARIDRLAYVVSEPRLSLKYRISPFIMIYLQADTHCRLLGGWKAAHNWHDAGEHASLIMRLCEATDGEWQA